MVLTNAYLTELLLLKNEITEKYYLVPSIKAEVFLLKDNIFDKINTNIKTKLLSKFD